MHIETKILMSQFMVKGIGQNMKALFKRSGSHNQLSVLSPCPSFCLVTY